MDFPKFQELVTNRYGFAQMENATATGEYFSDSCGDMYTFYLKIGPDERIDDISYFTTGCGFGVATCAIVTQLVKGKTVAEAESISTADVESFLGGYPERKITLREYWKRCELRSATTAKPRRPQAPQIVSQKFTNL